MKKFYYRYSVLLNGVRTNIGGTNIIRNSSGEYEIRDRSRWKRYMEDAEVEDVEYGDFSAEVKTRNVRALTFYCDSLSGCVEGTEHYRDGDGSNSHPWRSLHYAAKSIEKVMQCFYRDCCNKRYYFQIKVSGTVDYEASFYLSRGITASGYGWKSVRDLILDFEGCKFGFGANIYAGYAWVRNISADIDADSRENGDEYIGFGISDKSFIRGVDLNVSAETVDGMQTPALKIHFAGGQISEPEHTVAYNIRISQKNFLYARYSYSTPYAVESNAVSLNIGSVSIIDSEFENVSLFADRMYDCSVTINATKTVGINGPASGLGWMAREDEIRAINVSNGGVYCNVECSISFSVGIAYRKYMAAWAWAGYYDPTTCDVVFYHCSGIVSAALDCDAVETECYDESTGQYYPCTRYYGIVNGTGFLNLSCATFYNCLVVDQCAACADTDPICYPSPI